ncbi:MAG: ComF family protein [Xanthobacteraceae bacterium]|nr:MAG: ComF family protein [Xanthobacteraceae bacterium]
MDMETAPRPGLAARLGGIGAGIGIGLRGVLAGIARLMRDAALPAQCLACRAPVQDDGLCPSCWSKLSFIAPPYCERLGIPFAYDPGVGVLSPAAIADPPAYQRARAAVRYDDVARSLVHALKFHDRTDLAPAMGRWMAQAGAALLADADALVPVPLHWRRSLSRRYNQAALLATAISRQAPRVPVTHDFLKRARSTAHQVGLSRAERALNVQGAFKVPVEHKPLLRGRRLVLVDDILTTGATLDACARALLRGGAARVDVLVFARVVDGA